MSVISIIIPVYNIEKYLPRCVDSILAQTFVDFECVLVDDGSPDGCPAICDEYVAKDSRVKVIHQKNAGVSAARKTGLNIAQGNWIAFIDGDDTIPIYTLQSLLTKATDENLDIVIGDFQYVTPAGKFIRMTHNEQFYGTDIKSTIRAVFHFKCTGNLCGKLIKKELFDKITFPSDNIKIGEDIICGIQVMAVSQSIGILNEVIYNYVQHSTSTMNSLNPQKVNSMGLYIEWLKEYIGSNFSELMQDCSFFLLNEYFAYLMRGGKWEKKHGIVNLFLEIDKNELPLKLYITYHCYVNNAVIGNLIIYFARIVSKVIKILKDCYCLRRVVAQRHT
jgi:glycosyltransferase involved in cell wall biosynthesis